jgi:hypothetical protein
MLVPTNCLGRKRLDVPQSLASPRPGTETFCIWAIDLELTHFYPAYFSCLSGSHIPCLIMQEKGDLDLSVLFGKVASV